MMTIHIYIYRCPGTPIGGIITPVIGRAPTIPVRVPEPVVDIRSVIEHRNDHVVGTVYILVPHYLYLHLRGCFIFLNIYTGYILVDILRKYRLKDDETIAPFAGLHYADIIHFAVAIEIEVAELSLRVVELGLKLLQVLRFRKDLSYYPQIQTLRDVTVRGRDGYLFIGSCCGRGHHHEGRQP